MKEAFKKEKLISVIVPVYNVEQHIHKCIDSIINQTYKNLEIILVDDGSPDKCPKICDEYAKKDKRIKVIHQKNKGVSVARNNGIKKAIGEWITFVDADDWLEENYCRTLINVSTLYKGDYICCGYNRVYKGKTVLINADGSVKEYSPKEFLVKLLNVQNGYGFSHMKLIRKRILSDVSFEKALLVGEDALFNVMLCNKIKKAVVINKPLYNYNFNSNSVVRKYDKNYVDKYLTSMKYMSNYVNANYNNKDIKKNLYNYIAYHVLLIIVNYCYNPSNSNKFHSLNQVCGIDIFEDAIKKSNYTEMSITRKVTLFTLKHKLYLITALICKYRQMQFKR